MSRNTLTALVAVVLAVTCVAALWMLLRNPSTPASPPPLADISSPSSTPPALAAVTRPPRPARTGTAAAPAASAPQMQPWEMQIDQILRSNVSELEAAQILINTLPSLPEEGQVEAAHHISNLLADPDYSRVMPILLNPNMPESVLSVFVTDLMNRSDSTKLPALLAIAEISNHPFHEEAISDLQIYLNEDYGSDWARWKSAMDQYLSTAGANP